MEMRKSVLLCCFALLTGSSLAQKAVYIEYDYINAANTRIGYIGSLNDTVFSNKKTLKVKGSTPCLVRLLNYNVDALQTTSMLRKGINRDSVSAANVSSFINTFSSLVNPAIGINFSSLLPKSRGMAQPTLAMAALHPDFGELQANEEEPLAVLVKYDTLIRNKLSEMNRWQLLQNQLTQLRFTTKLSAGEIKAQAEKLIAMLTADAPLVLKENIQSRLVIRQLARENTDYLRLALVSLQKQVENAPISRGRDKTINEFDLAKENIKAYQLLIHGNTESDLLKVMDEILNAYQAIRNNPFETHLTLMLEDNVDLLQLNMYALNDKGQRLSKEPTQTQAFFVKTSGQIAIFNTIGISLMTFKTPAEVYSLKGTTIVSTQSDQLIPSFAFYMHFVGGAKRSLKLGGHFGVGIPLTESKSVNFQLGPTFVLGVQNAICLNLGIMAGKVQRLGGGYKVEMPIPVQQPCLPSIAMSWAFR